MKKARIQLQHVPPIVVKRIDVRAQLPHVPQRSINILRSIDGTFFLTGGEADAMDLFSGIVGGLQGRKTGTSVPAKPDPADARRPSVREEASKKPRIPSVGDGACIPSRSSTDDVWTAPSAEDAITVADDEGRAIREKKVSVPSAPSPGVQEVTSPEQGNVAPTTSSSGPPGSPGPPSGQRGPAHVSSTAQFFARNVCSHLDKIKESVTTKDQAAALEQKAVTLEQKAEIFERKIDEVLFLLRRLDPSEAERMIADLESKCTRLEGDLEAAVTQVEDLTAERGMLKSQVEELEEEIRRRREFARSVRNMLVESEPL
ncbi:hypothetical protein AXF42_Ash009558 [Apostasia shenzhenica]|uniref:Uncharacterized protein n=1 Tax=Apostasia shenzhenica TaxID=1088818 RepID=A0A2I0B968_9ASPA|nr:hypothetical protein AXF42_Ash009558 [Apostasia shenzhenica]